MTASSLLDVASADAQLAAEFATGNPETVRAVYESYGRLVFAVAYKVLGDTGLAEDATQQAFVQAWRAAERFDPSRDFAPWLATIARRAAIDVYRQTRRTREHAELDPADPQLVSSLPSAERSYELWEVRRAVDSLPADEAQLIKMQHFADMTHSEIAAALDLPIGTVKSRTYRAHRRLVELLGHLRTGEGGAS